TTSSLSVLIPILDCSNRSRRVLPRIGRSLTSVLLTAYIDLIDIETLLSAHRLHFPPIHDEFRLAEMILNAITRGQNLHLPFSSIEFTFFPV
ncbi:hypothetical protein PMAYCL1PPCAC_26144, partial [Pristionchus mayeri]